MKYVKQKQLCFNSGTNYDDLEGEIARLEKERQSAENEQKPIYERLGNLLKANNGDKAKFESVWREIEKSSRRLTYLTSLVDNCQMMKDGIIPLPKPRTDRSRSDHPIFDMYL